MGLTSLTRGLVVDFLRWRSPTFEPSHGILTTLMNRGKEIRVRKTTDQPFGVYLGAMKAFHFDNVSDSGKLILIQDSTANHRRGTFTKSL